MKKVFMFIFAILMIYHLQVFSQPGSSCTDPYVITTLPFNQSSMTTSGFPDIFDNTDACNSDYMTGNDFIFSYTPSVSQYINITLSGTGIGVGLFVTNGCPDPSGICVAENEAILGNPVLTNVLLIGGTTYFIIVSTWDPIYNYIPNPSTNFSIDITMENPFNLAIDEIVSPVSSCGLTSTENVEISITNYSLVPLDSIAVEYTINGIIQATDTIFDTIDPSSTLNHIFSVQADLSQTNTSYILKTYIKFTDDNPVDDTTTASITNSVLIDAFPYFEDFETDNGGYGSGGTNSSWAWGEPDKTVITNASSPTKCWVTNLVGNYNQNEISHLLFPCLDFSSLSAPVIEFDLWVVTSGLLDYCRLEYSKDNGSSWHTVGQQGDPINWYDSDNGWSTAQANFVTVRHRIDSLAGVANAKLRLYFFGSLVTQADGIAFDDIKIYQAPAFDLGISQVVSPVTSCGLTDSEYFEAKINNYGADPQSNFFVAYSVNGAPSTPEQITTTIDPGESLLYTFTTPVDMSVMQQYNILCYTSNAGDADPSNDTTALTINNLLSVSTYPYLQDFENSDGGWVGGGVNSSWAWGEPIKPVINHAASPTKCWTTNLTATSNILENSYLTGPCFDFSTLTLPEIDFNIWYATSTFAPGTDSIVLKVSVDSGATWTRVGSMGQGTNWYNTPDGWSGNSGGWIHAKHVLTGTGGEQNVQLRFYFFGPLSIPVDGLAIDDIHIRESPQNDLGVVEITAPQNGCNLSINEFVSIRYHNYGQVTQNDFELSYQVDNGPWVTQTMTWDIYAGETIYHTFSQTYDFSALASYTIRATTGLANDEDHSNDTISVTIVNEPAIDTFPFVDDFESDDGGWYTAGNSSWAWGVPASVTLNYAHSPVNVWKTNLTGNALTSEDSYLYSPCFDLSNMSVPTIELYVWHSTMPMMGSAGTLEVSVDGGVYWSVVGYNDFTNWYIQDMTGTNNGWTGASSGWTYKKHILDGCAFESSVKLRIHYKPGQVAITPEEGLAIDDIRIFDDCTPPDANFSYSASGTNVVFTNLTTGGTDYYWEFGDGNTSQNASPAHIYSDLGVYSVTLIASNICGSDTSEQLIDITSIDENDFNTYINCSPNPNNGTFTLTINTAVHENILLEINDMKGSTVYSEILKPSNSGIIKQFNFSELGKGVYFMKLQGEIIQAFKKIVIK